MRFGNLALQRAKIAKHGNSKLSVSILFAALLDGTKLPPVIMIPRIRQHDQLAAAGCFLAYGCSWANDRVAKLFIERVLQPVDLECLLLPVGCDISGQCAVDGMGRLSGSSLASDA